MSINPSFVNSQNINEATETTIRMVSSRPLIGVSVTGIPYEQNQLLGYYNSELGVVELFIADPRHDRYIKS